jgi:DNA polymerase-3 subunit epsilon
LTWQPDKIVEIAIVKLMPDGTFKRKRKLVNPQKPIPLVSSNVHGITDEMVKDCACFQTNCQRDKAVFE